MCTKIKRNITVKNINKMRNNTNNPAILKEITDAIHSLPNELSSLDYSTGVLNAYQRVEVDVKETLWKDKVIGEVKSILDETEVLRWSISNYKSRDASKFEAGDCVYIQLWDRAGINFMEMMANDKHLD